MMGYKVDSLLYIIYIHYKRKSTIVDISVLTVMEFQRGTVSENECYTPSKEHYGNEVSLNEQNQSSKSCQSLDQRLYQQTRFRSFQRGIVGLCRSKDCKATSCQSWRSEKNPAGRPRPHSNQPGRVRFPDDVIMFKVL